MGMILTDIVGLAKAGVEAKDLLTLQEKGYTQEVIEKLMNTDSPSLDDIKAKSEEEKKRLEDEKKAKDEAAAAEKKEKEELLKQLEEAQNKVNTKIKTLTIHIINSFVLFDIFYLLFFSYTLIIINSFIFILQNFKYCNSFLQILYIKFK